MVSQLADWLRATARLGAGLGLAVFAACAPTQAARHPIPPAYGPHIRLRPADLAKAPSFKADQRLVGTYYFYWYDVYSGAHIIDPDGTDALTTHPPTLEDFSYTSVRWHRKQLEDMMAAGIDFLLPVFWGAPSEQPSSSRLHWSYAGLGPLVQAREQLLAQGQSPPAIGMFYDTSTLRHNAWREHVDLKTDYGRAWFYATVRDFFSMIPPRHWATIEGRPIVVLYSAAFAKAYDQSVIDETKRRFAADFGGRIPYIIREVSWRVRADNVVAWGGALGLKNPGIASLGPGYDHSAVPGRQPLVVDREGGKFYERNWLKFLRRPSRFVLIETWNEFHEGTDIAESKEYGRQYITLTRKYADRFKRGWQPPWPKGPYTHAASVEIVFGRHPLMRGLRQLDNEDGRAVPESVQGREACAVVTRPGLGRYLYLAVDDSFKRTGLMDLELEVDYFDEAPGRLRVEYDGTDPAAPFAGAYTTSPDVVSLTGSRTWKTAQFHLPRSRLANGQNRGADLRLAVEAPALHVHRIVLRRQPASAGTRPAQGGRQ